MREFVDLDVLANWVSMLRADIDGAVWLSDDDEEARFYEKCAHSTARVLCVPNAAVRLLGTVTDRGIEGVIAAVRGIDNPAGTRGNVFRPSLGDVASLLLTSKASEQVIKDVCGGPWLNACEKQVGPVLHRAVWVARIFAKVVD